MEGNVRDADWHITETTPIVHRTTGSDEVLLGLEGHNYWHSQATRERLQQKLMRQWIADWPEDTKEIFDQEWARRQGAPEPLRAVLGGGS